MPRAFWFDLDNSPHVPLFRPIFSELEKRGTPCYVTARRHAQTHELLTLWDIKHTLLGTHAGKSKLKKIANLFQRAYGLSRLVRAQELKLAVSHGSRTQVLSAKRLGIPSVVMLDYEFSESRIFNLLASRLLIPSIIPDSRLKSAGFNLKKVIRYNGFKEQIYLKDFVPDKNFRATVGVREDTLLITVRPPSMSGNYHDNRSEALLRECIAHFSSSPEAHVLIVNRTGAEESLV